MTDPFGEQRTIELDALSRMHDRPTKQRDMICELLYDRTAAGRCDSVPRTRYRSPAGHGILGASVRILMLYGSLRDRSLSRLLREEVARPLTAMGAEVRTFNASNLPLPEDAPDTHPKVSDSLGSAKASDRRVHFVRDSQFAIVARIGTAGVAVEPDV